MVLHDDRNKVRPDKIHRTAFSFLANAFPAGPKSVLSIGKIFRGKGCIFGFPIREDKIFKANSARLHSVANAIGINRPSQIPRTIVLEGI